MKRNSLKQRNIINIMRSYGETQVLITSSSIKVKCFDPNISFSFIFRISCCFQNQLSAAH